MTDVIISPNMGMPIPVVGSAPGPEWAGYINACLGIIDSHLHSPGRGLPITPDGIDIASDLPFNNHNATEVRTVNYQVQTASLTDPADVGCTYVVAGDLYYNDTNGNQIRLTASGAPAGGAGSISGLPSGTASAAFSGGTFSFKSATNVPATMNVGPLVIGAANEISPNQITITPVPLLPASYTLVLPNALPSVTSYFKVDAFGNVSLQAPTGTGVVVQNISPSLTTPVITGITTGTAAAAGIVGETIVASGAGVSCPNSADTTIATLTLTAGEWLVCGCGVQDASAFTNEGMIWKLNKLGAGVGTTPGLDFIRQYCGSNANNTASGTFIFQKVSIISSTVTKTVVLTGRSVGTQVSSSAYLYAVRFT